jgi:hypothetical protein
MAIDFRKNLRKEAIDLVKEIKKKKENPEHIMKIKLSEIQNTPIEHLTVEKLGLILRTHLFRFYSKVIPALFKLNEHELAGTILTHLGRMRFEKLEDLFVFKEDDEKDFEKTVRKSVKALVGKSQNVNKIKEAYDTISNTLSDEFEEFPFLVTKAKIEKIKKEHIGQIKSSPYIS